MRKNSSTTDISKDILGNVFAALVMIGAIVAVFVAIGNFSDGNPIAGFISIGAAISCLVIFWLINTLISIRINLEEIKKNSDTIRIYCENKMSESSTTPKE